MPMSSSAVTGRYVPKPTKILRPQTPSLQQPRQLSQNPQSIKANISKLPEISSVEHKAAGNTSFFSSGAFELIMIGVAACVVCTAVVVPVVIITKISSEKTTNLTTLTTATAANTVTTTTTTTTTTKTTTTTTTTTTRTTTTTTSTTTTTTTTTTTSTTTTTTTTAPPSTSCVTTTTATFYNNQFLYSPTSQIYAAGMMNTCKTQPFRLNNQFAIYTAYGNGNVTTSTIWVASQSSTSQTAYLALQTDRNLVVYTTTGGVLWTPMTNNGGVGAPFCFQMLDSGNLIWTNSSGAIIWQSNSAQTG